MERQSMTMDRAVQVTYFLLRIVAGLLFVQTGGLILFDWFAGIPGEPGTSPLMSQTGIGGVLEFFGGIAIALGLGTRPVAFVLSGMMAVAYWQFSCTEWRVTGSESGHCRRPILFPLPVHGRAGRGRLEPRCADSTQTLSRCPLLLEFELGPVNLEMCSPDTTGKDSMCS
jgi:uncharacterized membrane protein YphA (DoxX/SURF4 family)